MKIYTPETITKTGIKYLADRNITLEHNQALVMISIVQKHTWAQIHEAERILEQHGIIHKFNHANGPVIVTTQDAASLLKLSL